MMAMNRREITKQETKELILAAARWLFYEMGPERCTMRDIAREAGVSPASVVVHFSSKTALLEAALHVDIERAMSGAVATMPDSEAGLLARMMHIATTMYTFYDNNRELYRVLIRDTFFEPAEHNPELSKQLDDYILFFAKLIEQEKQHGLVRQEADSKIAASTLFSVYFSVLMEMLRKPEIDLQAALALLQVSAGQLLSGILTFSQEKTDHGHSAQ